MNLIKKGMAAVTAAAVMASAAVPGIADCSSIFSSEVVSAAESDTLNYVFAASSETYDLSTLKSYEYYKKNNLVKQSALTEEFKQNKYDKNKVAEVTLSMKENAGFYTSQFILDYDERLVFAGCSVIESKVTEDNQQPVSLMESIDDSRISASVVYGKVMIYLKDGSCLTDTGDVVKVLFVLPDNAKNGDTYKVDVSDDSLIMIGRWDGLSNKTFSSVAGGITLKGDKTEPSAPPTSSAPGEITNPQVPSRLPVTDLLDKFDEKNQIEPAVNSTFAVQTESQMALAGDTAEFSVKLSDFDASKEYFDYGLLGLNLPEGFKIESVKVNSKNFDNSDIIDPTTLIGKGISSKTGFAATGGYIVLNGMDTSKFSADEEICRITVSVPEKASKMVNDVTIASAFARLMDDGKIHSFKTTSGKLYETITADIVTGLRGDVNLDGEVTQLDATIILKECLASEMGSDSVLKDNINMDAAGSYSEALSRFLGDVDSSSGGKKFEQLDATSMLRAILYTDMNGITGIPEDVWAEFIG